MESTFMVPEEFHASFQRLLPHMVAGLRNDAESLETILLYLKLGGERLARIAIDAFNQTHRLKQAQLQKQRLEEALLAEQMESSDDEDDDDEDEDGDDDDEGNDY